jgi:hypothetical protein
MAVLPACVAARLSMRGLGHLAWMLREGTGADTRRRLSSVCWEYDALLKGPVHDQSRHINRRQ